MAGNLDLPRHERPSGRTVVWGILLVLSMASCGTNDPARGGGGGLGGTVNGDGSSTVFPITEAIAEEFRVENPRINLTVGVSGTGGGFEKFCAGETDFSNASRPIKDEEKDACRDAGIEYLELTVAVDGLAVVVNPEARWVDCLTTGELSRIWEPDSPVDNWRQVRQGFPDEPVKLYSPGTDSGTFDYFTDAINGEEGASRNDRLVTFSEDDNTLVTGVAGDVGATGYFGYAFYEENQDKLKVLGVDGGDGCVTPSDETVKSNAYQPLSRPLFVYVRKDAAQQPAVKEFFDFYLATVNELVADVGYTALSDEQLAEQLSSWREFSGGAR